MRIFRNHLKIKKFLASSSSQNLSNLLIISTFDNYFTIVKLC